MDKHDMLYYFAHPYSATNKQKVNGNFLMANHRANKLLDLGFKVYSPVSMTHLLHEETERSWGFWMELDALFARKCDGLILGPGWEDSKGCKIEKEWFEKKGKPVMEYKHIIASEGKNA